MDHPTRPALIRKSIDVAISLGVVLLSLIVFGQTLTHPFSVVDDAEYVLENPHVNGGLSLRAVVWAFTHTRAANWHPLTWISHMVDCQIYALQPWGHHLTNVLLHSLSGALLFAALRSMTASRWRAAFVAAVFAIHPLRAESVAWVAERKDVLSAFFFVLTLIFYSEYARRPFAVTRYLLVLVCFAAGLMSKAMLVTVPCILVLLDYWPLGRRLHRRVFLEKLPLFLLSAGACLPTLFAQRTAMLPLEHFRITDRFENAAVSVFIYFRQLVWPADLAAFYPFEPIGRSRLILVVCFIGGVTALVSLGRRHRYLVTGWFWNLVMLLPVIGIVQVGEQAHADRYTYLPQIGLLLAIAWGTADLAAYLRVPGAALSVAAPLIIAALTLVAAEEVHAWQDPERLWRLALARTRDNETSRNSLGNVLYKKGDLKAAVSEFKRSLELREAQARVHSNLAGVLLELGETTAAYTHLDRALRLNPEEADALSNLGLLALESGDATASADYLTRAIAAKPDLPAAHYNYGNTLMELGRPADAIARFERALELNPIDERALNNVAWLLATWPDAAVRNGNEAVQYAERADRLTGEKVAVIHATLAAAYAEAGRFPEAIKSAERAAELAKNDGNMSLASAISDQLNAYREGKPWRDFRFASDDR